MDDVRVRRSSRRRSMATAAVRPQTAGESIHRKGTLTEKKRPKSALPSVFEDTELQAKCLDMDMESDQHNMRVFVRCRPLSASEKQNGNKEIVTAYPEESLVTISKPAKNGGVLKSEKGSLHEYQFDSVFGPRASTEQVYKSAARHLVAATLNGVNCTVFAYGATGAGKTFTMMGCDSDPGIISRALGDIFEGIDKARSQLQLPFPSNEFVGEDVISCEWSVQISFLEVYNETIFDLLTDNQKALIPCEDPTDYTVKVLGLTKVEASSVEKVMQLLAEGNTRRKMEPTAANQVSSRSHAVLQVSVVKTCELRKPGPRTSRSKFTLPRKVKTDSVLSMIDLAGSERAAATQNKGARLREGANINRSLLALANCINALSSRGKRSATRVKYRDSKLTHLLKSSLEGKCMLSMIAAINPCTTSYEESHNTLKYANRAKDIKVTAKMNNAISSQGIVDPDIYAALQAENQQLRRELEYNSTKTPSARKTRARSSSRRKGSATTTRTTDGKENGWNTDQNGTDVDMKIATSTSRKRKQIHAKKTKGLDSPLPSAPKRASLGGKSGPIRPLPFGDRTNGRQVVVSTGNQYKEEIETLKQELSCVKKQLKDAQNSATSEKLRLEARITFLENKNEAISRMAAEEGMQHKELDTARKKIAKLEALVTAQQEEIEALQLRQDCKPQQTVAHPPPIPQSVGEMVDIPAANPQSRRSTRHARRQSHIPRLYQPQHGNWSSLDNEQTEVQQPAPRHRSGRRRKSLIGLPPGFSTSPMETDP